jgi:hypothetical protein
MGQNRFRQVEINPKRHKKIKKQGPKKPDSLCFGYFPPNDVTFVLIKMKENTCKTKDYD